LKFERNSRGIPYLYFFLFILNERMDCTTRKQGKKSKRAKKQGRQTQKKKTDSYREILLPPDDPTGCDAYFPEEVASEVTSSFNHHIKMRQAQVPLNWNGIPTGSTERTFKTEVKTCFFSSIVTEHTDIIIKVHTFSS
jgi:hypothetical protein